MNLGGFPKRVFPFCDPQKFMFPVFPSPGSSRVTLEISPLLTAKWEGSQLRTRTLLMPRYFSPTPDPLSFGRNPLHWAQIPPF